jgi:putative transposase
MTGHIIKRHNKNLIMYHIVCPAKYRAGVFTKEVEQTLKETCEGISQRYEIYFIEIGADYDHVHFLVQSVPVLAPSNVVKMIKSISARMIFEKHPEVKKKLWGCQAPTLCNTKFSSWLRVKLGFGCGGFVGCEVCESWFCCCCEV